MGTEKRWQAAGIIGLALITLLSVSYALRSPSPQLTPLETASPAASAGATSSASIALTATPPASPAPAQAETSASANPPAPSSVAAGATVAFMGDSFAAGSGASAPALRWTSLLSAQYGWKELNVAHPQTGYLTSGTLGGCTPAVCRPFGQEIPDVVSAQPALVVITGGANDHPRDRASLRAAVAKTLNDLKSGLPGARIAVVNPWWDLRPMNPDLANLTSAIKAEVDSAGATWIDTGQPLQNPALMQPDGAHPRDAGHQALAAAVKDGLVAAGIAP